MKYNVLVACDATFEEDILVEAETEDEAVEKAVAMFIPEDPVHVGETYVQSIEEDE